MVHSSVSLKPEGLSTFAKLLTAGRRKPVFSRSSGDGRVRSVLGGGGAQALRVDAADRDPAAQDYAAALRLLQVVERDPDPDGESCLRASISST
jgi:hypothetical protein